MTTQDYPWHDKSWQQVWQQSVSGVLPHAYLFNGTKGIGKRDFALCLAGWLLCSGEKTESDRCGRCKQCKLFEAESHGDLRVIEPEEGSRAIKVDAIRELGEFIVQSSNQGGLKVAVICPAEALNINASNALLKTLEEPSAKSLIILVSHASGQLLPTIRSRCQVLDFQLPSEAQAIEWLRGSGNYSTEQAQAILDLAGGGPLQAAQLQELNALEEHDNMLKEMGAVLKRDVPPSLVAERWADDLSPLRLGWSIGWLQKICTSKLDGASTVLEGNAGEKMFKYLRDKCGPETLFALYDESLAQQRLLQGTSNPNKVLMFEHLFEKWINLIRN